MDTVFFWFDWWLIRIYDICDRWYEKDKKQWTENRALRHASVIINNSPYNTHAVPLFSKLNQLTIFDLNKLSIAAFMFQHYKNCLPNIFAHYFCTNSTIHNHDTRNAIKLHISYARTDLMKFQIRIFGPKLWNSIDPAIVNKSRHWHSFKQNYKAKKKYTCV